VFVRAARWTDAMMRVYVPHRHTLPSNARRISASSGSRSNLSNPTADMIMPAVQ
jgi:hypothetical protein